MSIVYILKVLRDSNEYNSLKVIGWGVCVFESKHDVFVFYFSALLHQGYIHLLYS